MQDGTGRRCAKTCDVKRNAKHEMFDKQFADDEPGIGQGQYAAQIMRAV